MTPSVKVKAFAQKYNMSIALALELMIEMFDEKAFANSELIKKVPMSVEQFLQSFNEEEALRQVDKASNRSGRPKESWNGTSKYPWDKWFDGKPHTLIQGKHFTSQINSFLAAAHAAARSRGIYVSTSGKGGIGKVTIQSRTTKKKK